MASLVANVEHDFFMANSKKDIDVIIDGCSVIMRIYIDKMEIEISGETDNKELRRLFFEILALMFLYLGGYPNILTLKINGVEEDRGKLLSLYSSQVAIVQFNELCEISEETINERIIKEYRSIHTRKGIGLKKRYIISLEYLVSNAYSSVTTDHRITLLAMIIEGMFEKEFKGGYSEYPKKLCEECVWKYDVDNMLKALNTDKDTFIKALTDTRNYNAHYSTRPKINKIVGGSDMLYYFIVMTVAIRIELINRIHVNMDEDRIVEVYKRLGEWIASNKEEKARRVGRIL